MRRVAYYIAVLLLIALIGGVMMGKNRLSQSNKQSQDAEAIFQNLSAEEANKLIQANADNPDFVILDVRTPEEYASGYIASAKLLDYYEPDFYKQLRRLDRSKTYLVYCRSGNRSAQTLQLMREAGFREAYNLLGGITAWVQQGLPVVQ